MRESRRNVDAASAIKTTQELAGKYSSSHAKNKF